MGRDVKLGLTGSLVVVVLACWYFAQNGGGPSAIPITENDRVVPLSPATHRPQTGATTAEGPIGESVHNESYASMGMPGGVAEQESETPAGETIEDTPFEDEETLVADRGGAPSPLEDVFRVEQGVPQPELDDAEAGGSSAGGAPALEDRGLRRSMRNKSLQPGTDRRHETHTVREGDTLADLARIYYGDVGYVGVLLRANAQVTDPTAMAVGTLIIIPDVDAPSSMMAETTARSSAAKDRNTANGRVYVVREGDTLYGIARDQLSSAGRWREIYALNKAVIGEDTRQLTVGQVLALPAK